MNRLIKKIVEKIPRDYFSSQELINLFPDNSNLRHSLIKRALADGDMIRIKRGLYYLPERFQKNGIDPYFFCQKIYGPSYISLETALSWHSWIPEAVFTITSVSLKKSKTFNTPIGVYSYSRVPQNTFFSLIEKVTDKNGNSFFMAHPLKALIDYFYINKKKWCGIMDLTNDLRIDSQELEKIPLKIYKELEKNYSNSKVKNFIYTLKKELFK